jgi:hypothetical protein
VEVQRLRTVSGSHMFRIMILTQGSAQESAVPVWVNVPPVSRRHDIVSFRGEDQVLSVLVDMARLAGHNSPLSLRAHVTERRTLDQMKHTCQSKSDA